MLPTVIQYLSLVINSGLKHYFSQCCFRQTQFCNAISNFCWFYALSLFCTFTLLLAFSLSPPRPLFFSPDFLCCPQMQQKGHVSSCSSVRYCKLETRAGPLHGTHGGRGGSEDCLPLCEVVTDFVVTKKCGITCRWLLGMAVMGILKCFD